MSRRPGPTAIATTTAISALLCGSLLLGACGSSTGSGSTAPSTGAAATSDACTQVSGALSDGPDPDADPIGYAQAQILPLRQIATTNHQLRAAVDGLAAAYQAVVTTNNSAAAKQAVSRAAHKVDAVCPGATS